MEEGVPARPDSTTYYENSSRSNASYGNVTISAPDQVGIPIVPGEHVDSTTTAAASEDPTSPDTLSKPPLYKRRWFIIVSVIGNCIGIAFLFIMLFPVVKAIIQDVVNKTAIDITTVAITNPTNTSFQLLMQGIVTHTGVFSAVISFPTPINVSWLDDSTKVPLGYMQLSTLYARNKQATMNDTTTFYITDQQAFGRFMSTMTSSQNFTWQLENYDLTVQAEKFPTAHGISFNKLVTVNGIDNFDGNVQLGDLQLPSENPASGMDFVTSLQLNSPSPFALELGTLILSLSYEGVYLGNGTVPNANLSAGYNNVTLGVVFVPQTTASDVAVVSQLIANFLNNQASPILATGNSTTQSDGTTISWLSQGVESLTMTIPF